MGIAKDESVEKCKEIEGVIDAYEAAEKDIETSTGKQKLERKSRGEVFKGKYYPPKFDFRSLYLYPDILSAIFNEVHSRNNGTAIQNVRIREYSDYKYLVIGNLESPGYMGGKEQELGFGDNEMMLQLQVRVEKLLDDQAIRGFVKDYHAKRSELDANSNVSKYEEERKRIWRVVNKESLPLRGYCDECSEEYRKSHF